MKSHRFKARIEIIGINPFVFVPEEILGEIFRQSGKEKGHIPVCGAVNRKAYKQTLVKYSGDWRLYINTTMLKDSPKRIGETIEVTIRHDPEDRTIKAHPAFAKALAANKEAKKEFDGLPPSRQKEIVRYISALKTAESVSRNVERAIGFLTGKNGFVGRMQKALIFPILSLFALTATAQNKCTLRLLRGPEEISGRSKQGLAIKGIHRSFKTDSIFVRTADKRKLSLGSGAVWGFQDSQCTIYRNAFHDFLKAEEIGDSIITYSRTYEGFRGKRIKSYYFSKRFDAPVFKLDKEDIHEQYRASPDLIDQFEKKFNL